MKSAIVNLAKRASFDSCSFTAPTDGPAKERRDSLESNLVGFRLLIGIFGSSQLRRDRFKLLIHFKLARTESLF